MSCRRKSCEWLCFYCEQSLAGERHEHDHVFAAARHNGEATVAVCLSCHNLKDRIPARNWPLFLLVQAFRECGPFGRILLAKALDMARDRDADLAATRDGAA